MMQFLAIENSNPSCFVHMYHCNVFFSIAIAGAVGIYWYVSEGWFIFHDQSNACTCAFNFAIGLAAARANIYIINIYIYER
jgi:hypothetical protein